MSMQDEDYVGYSMAARRFWYYDNDKRKHWKPYKYVPQWVKDWHNHQRRQAYRLKRIETTMIEAGIDPKQQSGYIDKVLAGPEADSLSGLSLRQLEMTAMSGEALGRYVNKVL